MSTPESQEKQKSPEPLETGEKNLVKAERIASSEAETGKEDYYVILTKQARALKKARSGGARTETHKEFGTPTIEGDNGILIPGGAPGPATLTDKRLQQLVKDEVPQGLADSSGRIVDYQVVQESKSSFSLGMAYEEQSPDMRTPIEKLGNFMQAATHRATDPEGWKSWAQSEVNKFAGIGPGLNEAKEETKAAVVAGWKALTDGTVVEFLSQPDAINAPVFKTVANAFDAMSKDPNAVNKAFEALGQVAMKASEDYTNLPAVEKGKVIGKAMFGMVNPEGSTEGAEAAFSVANRVANHFDQTVLDTIEKTLSATKGMAPDLAVQTKQALYDYLTNKGVTSAVLKSLGIADNYFDDLARTADSQGLRRLQDSELPSLAGAPGGDWTILNEHPSPDVVLQVHPNACASAVGEMISDGAVKQEFLVQELSKYWHPELLAKMKHPTAALEWLAQELGPTFKFVDVVDKFDVAKLDSLLSMKNSWATELKSPGKIAHAIAVDGVDHNGLIMIRDPFEATRYEMTRDEFVRFWTGRLVRKLGD